MVVEFQDFDKISVTQKKTLKSLLRAYLASMPFEFKKKRLFGFGLNMAFILGNLLWTPYMVT